MELSASYITGLVALIGVIVWLVRMESKTNTNASDITDLYSHTQDREIHHSAEDLNRRFETLTDAVNGIKTEVKSGMDKLSDRIDRLLTK